MAILVAGAFPNGYFQVTRNWLFDFYQRLAPAERSADGITIIDIDEASLSRIGQWPWSRSVLARLVDAAQGARVIGLDLILAEQDRQSPDVWAAGRTDLPAAIGDALRALPSTDGLLARSIARAPVVLPVAVAQGEASPDVGEKPSSAHEFPSIAGSRIGGAGPPGSLPNANAVVPPVSGLAAAASGIGVSTVPSEFDGVLRRIPVAFDIGGTAVPSFAAEIVRLAMQSGPITLVGGKAGLSRVRIGNLTVRTDRIGRVWPRYASRTPAVQVPAWQVLDGATDPRLFRDHIVLIGATAAGLQDAVVTPLRQGVPGIAAYAQVIASIVAGDTLWRPSLMIAVELFFTLLAGIAALLLLRRVGVLCYALVFAVLAAVLIGASALSFGTVGLLLDWTFPLTAVGSTALLALAVQTRREAVQRRQRESELETAWLTVDAADRAKNELENALLTAEAADRAKTEFLANMSHELRTPLSAVIGFSEMMSRQIMGPLNRVYEDYARDIHKSGRHLLAVIDDILDLSVLELGGNRRPEDRVSPLVAIEDCRRMMMPRAQHRGVVLKLEADDDLPDLRADFRMLKQMVLNLLSNAIKYAPPGSDVVVRATMRDHCLAISVADLGRGIAPDDLAKVTQRFGRLHSSRLAQEPGVGIGLALTKSMIELHGGRLDVESEVGLGTTVLLWFPATSILVKEER